jgi:hypothetical protein
MNPTYNEVNSKTIAQHLIYNAKDKQSREFAELGISHLISEIKPIIYSKMY